MLQPGVLGRDLLPLSLPGRELFQVPRLLFDVRALALALREVLLCFLDQRLQPPPRAKGTGNLAHQILDTRMRIEERALRSRAQERLVLVLAVDVDKILARRLELREGRGVAVDEAARAA